MDKKKKTVFVGLSGGVDSSVAALLLQKEGHRVVGVYLRTWQPLWLECTWRDERRDAMRVAATLGIPFLEMDVSEKYKEKVITHMINEYKQGRTPNPDVLCNKEIKFGLFLEAALKKGADYIATGHYAEVDYSKKDNTFSLLRGIDPQKDQSYFLWKLTQKELKHVLFPIGAFTKTHVRSLAKKYKLPTYNKPDSQGICFVGNVSMKEFLLHEIKTKEGVLYDEKGQVVGSHLGAALYTIGERHGFHVNQKTDHSEPLYVIGTDVSKNKVLVSTKKPLFEKGDNIVLSNISWVSREPKEGEKIEVQFRHRGEAIGAVIKQIEKNKVTCELLSGTAKTAPGQSSVLYQNRNCLGGGVLE